MPSVMQTNSALKSEQAQFTAYSIFSKTLFITVTPRFYKISAKDFLDLFSDKTSRATTVNKVEPNNTHLVLGEAVVQGKKYLLPKMRRLVEQGMYTPRQSGLTFFFNQQLEHNVFLYQFIDFFLKKFVGFKYKFSTVLQLKRYPQHKLFTLCMVTLNINRIAEGQYLSQNSYTQMSVLQNDGSNWLVLFVCLF